MSSLRSIFVLEPTTHNSLGSVAVLVDILETHLIKVVVLPKGSNFCDDLSRSLAKYFIRAICFSTAAFKSLNSDKMFCK